MKLKISSVVVSLFVVALAIGCSSPTTRACQPAGDCLSGEQCLQSICVGGSIQCIRNTDCGEGKTCTDGSCQSGNGTSTTTQCTKNADCPSGQSCQSSGFCKDIPGGSGGGVVTTCGDDSMCPSTQYCNRGQCEDKLPGFEAFTAQTVSIKSDASYTLSGSLIDTKGLTACGLAQSGSATPGGEARQIYFTLGLNTTAACASGTYTLVNMECGSNPENAARQGKACAWFRKWDAQGKQVGLEKATGGAIALRDVGASCNVTVEFSFSGKSYKLNFEVRWENPGEACKEL
ncbi:MAG: hypothetical protein EP343_24795 [Deltaproteobacteria bacterium]|nr:MAG: hypothetical protein EP343_24795 [Deltaproteobacteria bacterium]